MQPDGIRFRTDPKSPDTFLFDCRTVPQPPNLVYIFRGVCNRSGFVPSADDASGYRVGCPILTCDYNCRDERRLLTTQADYHLSLATDLKAEKTAPDVTHLRVIRCPKRSLFAFDPQPGGTRHCPLCGESLPEEPSTEEREFHYSGPLHFDPPLTMVQALATRKPDPNVEAVCDPEVFHPNADLRGRDLRSEALFFAQLREADLRGANLEAVPLLHASLDHARLGSANLVSANLEGADLSHADLTRANLQNARLRGVNLSHAVLVEANLTGADLNAAKLTNAIAAGATLRRANLAQAVAENADFSATILDDVDMREAQCKRATFYRAQLTQVRAPQATFESVDFRDARIERCAFRGAVLRRANFQGATVRDTDFAMANLIWARTEQWRAERVEMEGARVSQRREVQSGPGVAPPPVVEQEVSRSPLSSQEREDFVRRSTP